MDLKPLKGMVQVEMLDDDGLVQVRAVGPGGQVKPGDVVMLSKWTYCAVCGEKVAACESDANASPGPMSEDDDDDDECPAGAGCHIVNDGNIAAKIS